MATPVEQVLTVCGATAAQIVAFETREQLNQLRDYADMTAAELASTVSSLAKRTTAEGKCIIPTKLHKNIKALCFWARERVRQQLALDEDLFDDDALVATKDQMKLRDDNVSAAPSIKPAQFVAAKWHDWHKAFVTYLSNYKGVQLAELDYITREHTVLPAGHVHLNTRDGNLYKFPLSGEYFAEDNRTVYRMLADLMVGTDGYTWIEEYDRSQNGRAAWLKLVEHYNGGGQQEKAIARAEALIRTTHYKNETLFPFETFSSRLLGAYRDLEIHGRPKSQYEQVRDTLERIHLTEPRAEIAKAHVRCYFRTDLTGALMYLSREFAEMYPEATFQPSDRRRRQISAAEEGSRQRQRTDDGDEPKTVNGVITYNGVNVTDVGATISSEDMNRLGRTGQAYLFQERTRLGLSRGRGRGYQGRGRGRGRGYQGRGRGYYGGDQDRNVGALASDTTVASEVTTGTTPGTVAVSLPPPSIGLPPPTNGSRGGQNGSRFGAGQHQA
jgi:hypothetical protein